MLISTTKATVSFFKIIISDLEVVICLFCVDIHTFITHSYYNGEKAEDSRLLPECKM